jgi:hypothetical protein
MSKQVKSFYIGWRSNRQLTNGGYYKAYGQLSKADAKRKEQCAYGAMVLMPYPDLESYNAALEQHRSRGYSIY